MEDRFLKDIKSKFHDAIQLESVRERDNALENLRDFMESHYGEFLPLAIKFVTIGHGVNSQLQEAIGLYRNIVKEHSSSGNTAKIIGENRVNGDDDHKSVLFA